MTTSPPLPAGFILGPLASSGSPQPLRRLPVPVLEPRAATLFDRGDDATPPPQQQVLDFWTGVGADTDRPDPNPPGQDDQGPDGEQRHRVNPRRRTVPVPPQGTAPQGTAPQGTAPQGTAPEGPGPDQWAARFVLAAVEAAAGIRPPAQLVRWTTPEVLGVIERRSELARRMAKQRRTRIPEPRTARRVVVRTVRCCHVRPGVCEAAAVVVDHGRTRAVALRLEQLDNRWRVTVLELG
jgi:hypothetical protein